MHRRSLVITCAVAALVIAAGLAWSDPPKPSEQAAVTVFRVGKGERYHREDCKHCRRKGKFIGVALSLVAAGRSGLTPCKDCKPPPIPANKIVGKVVRIIDGDTVVLDDGKEPHTIRLDGIDAPEGKQRFGAEAKAAIDSKILNKQVNVEWRSKDKYERPLGQVYLGERWVNLEMVVDGFAWHFTKYNSDSRLADAKKTARTARKGLWVDENPIPPWEFDSKKSKPK